MHLLVLPITGTLSSPIATHATPLKSTGWHTKIQLTLSMMPLSGRTHLALNSERQPLRSRSQDRDRERGGLKLVNWQ
ncbi:hypothetical protein LINPERPRIM_LOCUS33268 [Linum perenne]